MLEHKNNKIFIASDQEIVHLNKMMNSFDSNVSGLMSYVRRAQGLTFDQLDRRFSGAQSDALKRYMHQSYSSMRPLHIVAAYSWITMVPMTTLFYGFKPDKFYTGMNDSLVEALVCIGRLPADILNIFLEMICNMLNEALRRKFLTFREQIESEYGKMEDHRHLLVPEVLDLDAFAIDYYRSVAITVKQFREENNLPIDTISRVLGLSTYDYNLLENPHKTRQFPISIGFRIMQGFQLHSHVNFTSEMRQFPEFHQIRQVQHVQHVRNSLTVEALKLLGESERKSMINVLITLLDMYK